MWVVCSVLFLVFVSQCFANNLSSGIAPVRSVDVSNIDIGWRYHEFDNPPNSVRAYFTEIAKGCFTPGSILCMCFKNELFKSRVHQLLCPPRTLHLCLLKHEHYAELVLTSNRILKDKLDDNPGETITMELEFSASGAEKSQAKKHVFAFKLGKSLTGEYTIWNFRANTTTNSTDVPSSTTDKPDSEGYPILYRFVSNNEQCSATFSFEAPNRDAAVETLKQKYKKLYKSEIFNFETHSSWFYNILYLSVISTVAFVKLMMAGLFVYKLNREK